jgi:succinyl-CoA synthetase alpha subunit
MGVEQLHCVDPKSSFTKLSALLDARSIAIVGASADPLKLGSRPLMLLQQHGFAGPIYPVNPSRNEIAGVKAYPSLRNIGQPIDLALILTAAEGTVAAIEEGIACGVRSFILFASGFAEDNDEGVRRQQRITELAQESGSSILGPNCVGAMNVATGLCATIASVGEVIKFDRGPISIVSQSGAIGGYLLDMALRAKLGFSKWITSGNEADISMADCIHYLAQDASTQVICIYLEAIRDPYALRLALAQAAEHGKFILVLRSGRSAAGADAVASHTAGLTGDSQICDAFLAQYGVQQVGSMTEMIDAAKMLVWGARHLVTAPALVSVSGGAGALMADAVCAHGLVLRPFGSSVTQAVHAELPSFAKASNPLDLTGMVGANPALLAKVLEPIILESQHDLVMVFIGLMYGTAQGLVDALVSAAGSETCPLVVIWVSAPPSAVESLRHQQIAVFDDIAQAASALGLSNDLKISGNASRCLPPLEQAHRLPGAALTEVVAHEVLGSILGLKFPHEVLVKGSDDLSSLTCGMVLPWAAKLQSPQVLHKTEHGAVLLGLQDVNAVTKAVKALMQIGQNLRVDCEGVLLQEMIAHELQMIVGVRWDVLYGPLLLLGQGGVDVETKRDVVIRLLPLSVEQIQEAILSLRMARRLQGSRGRTPINVRSLAQIVHSMCEMYLTRTDFYEIEINPLALSAPATFTALDMLLRLAAISVGSAGDRRA